MVETQEFTISLPIGTTNHSDPHLLCPPARWDRTALFFITNYFIHAATVKLPPATTFLSKLWIGTSALFMPATGLVFGLFAFLQYFKSTNTSELRKATLAGALCMYVRTEGYPPKGHSLSIEAEIKDLRVPPLNSTTPGDRLLLKLHSSATRLSRSVGQLMLHRLLIICVRQLVTFSPWTIIKLAWTLDVQETGALLETDPGTNMQMQQVKPVVSNNIAGAAKPESSATDSNNSLQQVVDKPPPCILIRHVSKSQLIPVYSRTSVHGMYHHVTGYELVHVPWDAVVKPLTDVVDNLPRMGEKTKIHLSRDRDTAKSLVALLQLCSSIFVLTRARANQIQIYGYAAFSLTVAPYAVMAAVNLLMNAFIPSYPSLFLVRNNVMAEMENVLGLKFTEVVGELEQTANDNEPKVTIIRNDDGAVMVTQPSDSSEPRVFRALTVDEALTLGNIPIQELKVKTQWGLVPSSGYKSSLASLVTVLLGVLLICAPVAIVGVISKFQKGTESTTYQRVVLMVWLGMGPAFGAIAAFMMIFSSPRESIRASLATFGPLYLTQPLRRRLGIRDEVTSLHDWRSLVVSIWINLFLFAMSATYPIVLVILLFFQYKMIMAFARKHEKITEVVFAVFITLLLGVPAIMGFEVVGQMLTSYGNCIRIY